MRRFSIILFSILTIFCMAFIFAQSAKNGEASSSASSGISDSVANAIRPENPETDRTPDDAPTPQRQTFLSKVHDAVRKAAHAIEFAALAFFAYLLALSLGLDKTKKKTALALPCILLFSILYAFLDEWHQTSVPGRAFELADVGVDTLGAALGVAFAFLAYLLFVRIKRKKENETT